MWNEETEEYIIEIDIDETKNMICTLSSVKMNIGWIFDESAYPETHCITINHIREALSQHVIYSELELSVGYKGQIKRSSISIDFDMANLKVFVILRNLKDLRQYRSTVKLEEVFGVAK